MQAILDDLTIDDYFSIIDFNHNVRCWSNDLVPGSSIQVKDAKTYIQNIKPNGGENTPPHPPSGQSNCSEGLIHETFRVCDFRDQHQRGPDASHPDAGEGVQPGPHRPSVRLHDHPGVRWRPHSG